MYINNHQSNIKYIWILGHWSYTAHLLEYFDITASELTCRWQSLYKVLRFPNRRNKLEHNNERKQLGDLGDNQTINIIILYPISKKKK
jgi:hypothetical protein